MTFDIKPTREWELAVGTRSQLLNSLPIEQVTVIPKSDFDRLHEAFKKAIEQREQLIDCYFNTKEPRDRTRTEYNAELQAILDQPPERTE